MFKQKTVFVVGAGASFEFNLPVGDKLKGIIATKLNVRLGDSGEVKSGDRLVLSAMQILAQERGGGGNLNALIGAGREISQAMPSSISIDNFLHYHSNNPDIVAAGKIAIAASILEAEGSSSLFSSDYGSPIDFVKNEGTWINAFCKILSDGLQKSDLPHVFDNVSIITFNYDRCIEHYIAQWLVNYTRISETEAWALLKKLTIIHPYGRVGALPLYQAAQAVPYGVKLDRGELLNVSRQIRTFTEQVEDETVTYQMRDIISESDQIVYLGFAFATMNMDLMTVTKGGPVKLIYGTTFGISAQNVEAILHRIIKSLNRPEAGMAGSRYLTGSTASNFLKDHWNLLIQ